MNRRYWLVCTATLVGLYCLNWAFYSKIYPQTKHTKENCNQKFSSYLSYQCFSFTELDEVQKSTLKRYPMVLTHFEYHAGVKKALESLQLLVSPMVNLTIQYIDAVELMQQVQQTSKYNLSGTTHKLESAGSFPWTFWYLCPRQRIVKKALYDYLKQTDWFQRTTFFFFAAPVSVADAFMSFGKPIVVQAPYGLELGRSTMHDAATSNYYFQDAVDNFQLMLDKHPERNFIFAQSVWDWYYWAYVVGRTVDRLPLHSVWPQVKWTGEKHRSVLFTPTRGATTTVAWHYFQQAKILSNWTFSQIKYSKEVTVTDMAKYAAVVFIPYKHATNMFLELYHMGIPLFVPSLAFLHSFYAGNEDYWWGGPPRATLHPPVLYHPPHPYSTFKTKQDINAEYWWMSHSDHYTYPHIVFFRSWRELIDKLNSANLVAISQAIQQASQYFQRYTENKWYTTLFQIQKLSQNALTLNDDYDAQLMELYGKQEDYEYENSHPINHFICSNQYWKE